MMKRLWEAEKSCKFTGYTEKWSNPGFMEVGPSENFAFISTIQTYYFRPWNMMDGPDGEVPGPGNILFIVLEEI